MSKAASGWFVIKKRKNGDLYFILKARNGMILMTSDNYTSKTGVMGGIWAVRKAMDAEIIDETK